MSVSLEINSKRVTARPEATLFEHAEELGVRVPTSCFKQGKCRECLVQVVEGMDLLSAPTAEEEHLREGFRLSCRTQVVGGEGRVRCHTLRRAAMRIEEDSSGIDSGLPAGEVDPAVRREGDRILLDDVEIARGAGPLHGLSVDLGTTTVVVRLLDLETGKRLATQSFENPQRFAGTDVMARIHYDTHNKGKLQQRTLLGYLTHAIEAFPCEPETIYEMTIAGNATMRDIFFGLDVFTIGQKPYRSLVEHEFLEGKRATTSFTVPARRLRLPMHPAARVYGLPLIGSHVGADAAAALLAIDFLNEERTVALMDIGTNTELVIGNRHRALAASCPAGPAFEGGSIACGMPGLEGAIEGVRIGADDGVECRVIGTDCRAEGICGSGLVELLGELLRTERMNGLGRFADGSDRFGLDAGGELFVCEGDISELAQAKGANVAGLHIVLKNYGIRFDELDCFYLAGGFARHLDVDASRRIGLIPDLPDETLVQVGNASIEGATIALLSKSRRDALEAFVPTIQHVELETDPDFFNYFVEGCQFQRVI